TPRRVPSRQTPGPRPAPDRRLRTHLVPRQYRTPPRPRTSRARSRWVLRQVPRLPLCQARPRRIGFVPAIRRQRTPRLPRRPHFAPELAANRGACFSLPIRAKLGPGVSTFSTRVCALMPSSSRRASLVRARFEAPLGALENSPGRKPCGTGPETRQPRRGVRRPFVPGDGRIPVKRVFRPSGAPCRTRLFPWLTPWATFSRPSGADAHESYQQNVVPMARAMGYFLAPLWG